MYTVYIVFLTLEQSMKMDTNWSSSSMDWLMKQTCKQTNKQKVNEKLNIKKQT